jgi:putative flippase GtrA
MQQLLRFSTVGVLNSIVGLLCIWGAMYFLGLGEVAANLLGYAIGLVVSFSLNRTWTFSDRGDASRSFPRWLALAGVAYVVNLAVVIAAYRVVGIDPYLAQPLGIAAYTAIMFFGSRAFVFREPRSSRRP